MKKQKISLNKLVEDLKFDLDAFEGEEIIPQIIYMHLRRAYKLGEEENTELDDKFWWKAVDKDEQYIKEQSNIIEFKRSK